MTLSSVSDPIISLEIPDITLYVGTNVSVTCNIIFESSVDRNISVDVTWQCEGIALSNNFNANRVSISPTIIGNTTAFHSTLTLSPLMARDNINFSCKAFAYSHNNFIRNSSASKVDIFIPVSIRS